MKIPRHWWRAAVRLDGSEASEGGFVAYGWSERSIDEARAMALDRARGVARWFLHHRDQSDLRRGSDYYLSRPICEPVERWIGPESAPIAAITRNAYGAFVLNAARVMFIDVDLPPPPPTPGGVIAWLSGLFGSRPEPQDPAIQVEARLREVIERERDLGLRLYRTHSGFRVLITSRTFEPDSVASHRLLEAFDADPLYRRLCSAQACYRARLTAKPWRIGLSSPPVRYLPVEPDSVRAERRASWERDYEIACGGTIVCRLLLDRPRSPPPAEVEEVVAEHDHWCLGEGRLA